MKSLSARSVFALALVATAFTANAALTTLSGSDWPPAGSSGLGAVLFNVNSANGIQVGLGAHAYKESAVVPTNGVDTFYVNTGLSPNPPLTNARWALDYSINYGTGTLQNYITRFSFDIDPTSGQSFKTFDLDASNCAAFGACGLSVYADSQNATFIYAQLAAQGSGYTFNPFARGDFDFALEVFSPAGARLTGSAITVETVPEPGSLALVGVALLGAFGARRHIKRG